MALCACALCMEEVHHGKHVEDMYTACARLGAWYMACMHVRVCFACKEMIMGLALLHILLAKNIVTLEDTSPIDILTH